jgi:predicted permease
MWFRRRRDGDFQAEIESHIALEADRLIAEGMPGEEARVAARRAFGNVAIVQERFYEGQRCLWWDNLGRDLRYGFRLLWKSPAFTAAAALTIALGLGANTAIFSLVDAVLLQLLPVHEPKQIVFVDAAGNTPQSGAPPYPCLDRLPTTTDSFTGLAVFATDELRIEIDGNPEPVFGQAASGNYFELLGVKPALGRLMDAREGTRDHPIAVISDRYWQRRFNRDPGVLGKSIIVGDRNYTIAGVTRPEFLGIEHGRRVDLTIPIDTSGGIQTYVGPWWFDVIARLKPGVSLSRAQAAANVAFEACMSASAPGAEQGGRRFRLALNSAAHGSEALRSRFSRPLFALMGTVILVLLLATVNVANLLLARGISRSGEFAIRLATGSSRVHLARQLLTETLILFGLGAVPGITLAGWGVAAITALFAQGRRPIFLETTLNWRILAVSIAVTLAAGLLSSLFPVWRAFRTDLSQGIREGPERTSESRLSAALMRALVGLQVALSLVVLTGAITLARTLVNLRDVDPGFRNTDALTMSIELPKSSMAYGSVEAWRRVMVTVRETPGVGSAALCTYTPLSGRDSGATPVEVRGYRPAYGDGSTVRLNHVSEDYFETLGIELIRGRLLSDLDREGSLKVAVLNQSATRRLFGERDPIGQAIEFPGKGAPVAEYRIVGVVSDTKHNSLREPSLPLAFISIWQPLEASGRLTLTVASATPSGQAALLQSLQRRLAAADPRLLISEVITMRRQLESTLITERLLSGLSTAFGVLALILASVGLYGVQSYRVGQQRQAIGIQMALGASPYSVTWSVLRQSGYVIAVGLLCGLPFAFAAARIADSLLWGVKSSDPAVYLVGAAILCLAGFVSAWLPARHASTIQPAEALRHN